MFVARNYYAMTMHSNFITIMSIKNSDRIVAILYEMFDRQHEH